MGVTIAHSTSDVVYRSFVATLHCSCARSGNPGVYTRLSAYASFLQTGICALSSARPNWCPQRPTPSVPPPPVPVPVPTPVAVAPTPTTQAARTPCSTTLACGKKGYTMRYQSGSSCMNKCVTRNFELWKTIGFACGTCAKR